MRSGASGSLAFLYGDQVGSTVYATDAGAATVASMFVGNTIIPPLQK